MCYIIKKINKIKNKVINQNKQIKIKGWIKNIRTSKIGIFFIDINDGTSLNHLQIIVNKEIICNLNKKITNGCSIKAKGIIFYNKKIKKNEIKIKNMKIIGHIKNPKKYPIGKKYHSLEYLRSISHFRPRTKIISSISRIRQSLVYYLHQFFQKHNFIWIPTPILTSLDTEGYSKMFEIKNKIFKKKTFLTVSGQLNLESYACAIPKVYNFGPVFRAENSNTTKHLTEFWMLEAEIGFYNLKKTIEICKKMLFYTVKNTIKHNHEDINFLIKYNKSNLNIDYLLKNNIVELDYIDIINILKKKEKIFTNPIKWGTNITTEHEIFLTEKYFKSPVIIKNYPKQIKPFYMKINKDQKTVSCMDIIYPHIGEIIGGSERESNIKKLDNNILSKKLNKKNYWWYRELRKFGTIPHSGFGLGLERLLMYITSMKNIRDVTPFPRYPKNLNF